jgi:thiamine-phosphate pyrophosphorylase
MNHLSNIYYFIKDFNRNEILNLDKNINIIFRNYELKEKEPLLLQIKDFCKKINRKLFLANNLNIALKLNLDGLYIPSFNNILKYKNINKRRNFKLIGSAHNKVELRTKKLQGCSQIFLSPIFKTQKNKYYLGTVKFNSINLNNTTKIIALGGINNLNLKKLKLTKVSGFASISWIKKNQPKRI